MLQLLEGSFVPQSRLWPDDLTAPSTNVRFGVAARQRTIKADRPLWADCADCSLPRTRSGA